MRSRTCGSTIFMILVLAVVVVAQEIKPHSTAVVVPDEPTAVSLAEKAFIRVYGKKMVESERPFKAALLNGVWHVSGTLHCHDREGNVVQGICPGGTAEADVRQRDGRVLRVLHTK